jgi:predicted dehydrogenase
MRTRRGHTQSLPEELGVKEVTAWSDLEELNPDVAIVANPTSEHLATVKRLLPNVRGVFVEKPLAGSSDGVTEVRDLIRAHGIVSFMGHSLNFHPIAATIAHALASGKFGEALCFQGAVGHWLPDWHPGEDFTKSYAARPELGGGVALTLIHEVLLAIHWFGPVARVAGVFPPNELLKLDVDVHADMMLHHSNGAVSQLHLDFIQRPYHRSGKVCCERGWLSYDFASGRVLAQADREDAPIELWNGQSYDIALCYESMMAAFLARVREGRVRHEFDIDSGVEGLSVVLAAFKSQKEMKWIRPNSSGEAQ